MQRTTVISSNLASVGYDPTTSTLEIAFLKSGVYEYFDVPAHVFKGLMNASSHGEYFDLNVKKAGFKYQKKSS